MHPKEVRQKVLEFVYNSQDRYFVDVSNLRNALSNVPDKDLHEAILYLEGRHFIEIPSKTTGGPYFYYPILRITTTGIDLVEDPDSLNEKVTVTMNHFANNSGNVSVNSPGSTQSIVIKSTDISPELAKILIELKRALNSQDTDVIWPLLQQIQTLSENVFLKIILSGVFAIPC